MSESNETPKKISLQEAVKRQLEAKKNQASGKKGSGGNASLETKKMKSQQTKKVNNTRRKMGV